MDIVVAVPIFNPKNYRRLYETTQSSLYKIGENTTAFTLVLKTEKFPYYFVITKTLNLRRIKYI